DAHDAPSGSNQRPFSKLPGNELRANSRQSRQHIIESCSGEVTVAQSFENPRRLRDVTFWKPYKIKKVDPFFFVQHCERLPELFISQRALIDWFRQFGEVEHRGKSHCQK